MNLNLPAGANEFVKSVEAPGKYQSEEEAVMDGIRLMLVREALRSKIAVRIAQLYCGNSFDEESVFDALLNADDERVGNFEQWQKFNTMREMTYYPL